MESSKEETLKENENEIPSLYADRCSDVALHQALAQSDAQKSFDKLKTLAGSWEGRFEGKPLQVSLRVTSMGNALMHEMKGDGPEDPITHG